MSEVKPKSVNSTTTQKQNRGWGKAMGYNLIAHLPCCGSAILLAFAVNAAGVLGSTLEAFHAALHTPSAIAIQLLVIPVVAGLALAIRSARHDHKHSESEVSCGDVQDENPEKDINYKSYVFNKTTAVVIALGFILQLGVIGADRLFHEMQDDHHGHDHAHEHVHDAALPSSSLRIDQ